MLTHIPLLTALFLATLVLKRLHRAKGRSQVQAAPPSRHLVERMLAAAGLSKIDLRNPALLAES